MTPKIKHDILFYILAVPALIIFVILSPFGKGLDFTIWADKKLNKWSGK